MERQHLIDWIDQYLLDELQGEELRRFRQRLETDAGFRREVEMQRALFRQARQVGRENLRRHLKQMHQRLALPWPPEAPGQASHHPPRLQLRPKRFARVSPYSLVASLVLVLVAVLSWFLLSREAPGPEIARYRRPEARAASPELARIRLEGGGERAFGFGGAGAKDSTLAVLIYAAPTLARTYRFDDTLRLYGTFVPGRLALRLDPNTGVYALREDSLLYPLQRYRPRQALLPAR